MSQGIKADGAEDLCLRIPKGFSHCYGGSRFYVLLIFLRVSFLTIFPLLSSISSNLSIRDIPGQSNYYLSLHLSTV